MADTEAVVAVVVLYRPDAEALKRQFDGLDPQVRAVVYQDNGDGQAALARVGLLGRPNVSCVGDGTNLGIAAGLNRGVEVALRHDPRFVLLLDQDSVPPPAMVRCLIDTYERASSRGAPVAAVGPSIFDGLSGRQEGLGQARERAKRHAPRTTAPFAAAEPIEVSYLITSGTLVPAAMFAEVGPMEESLFIDSVDFEWCYRARAKGFPIFATYATALLHHRGERLHRTWFGWTFRLHSTARLFFIFRNHTRLCFRRYMPVAWRIRGWWYLAVRAVQLGLFADGRRRSLSAMARGIWQGLALGLADRRGGG